MARTPRRASAHQFRSNTVAIGRLLRMIWGCGLPIGAQQRAMTHGRVVAVFFRGLSRDVEAEASGAAGPEDRLRDPSKVIIASPEFMSSLAFEESSAPAPSPS